MPDSQPPIEVAPELPGGDPESRRRIDRRTALRAIGGAGALLAVGVALPGSSAALVPKPLIDQATWGAYASREPWPDCQAHFDLEHKLGTRLPVMSWFLTWSISWPKAGGQQAAAGRYDLHIAWQPELDDDTPILFADIVAGRHDDYLTRFFTAAKNHPGQVVIRFAHEMNGDGYPWSAAYRGPGGKCLQTPAEYVRGWRYVVNFQRRIGGSNVKFAWCIMTNDKGGIAAEEYFPGYEYVDILSMDVYNGYGGGWQEPGAAISKTYNRLTALSRSRPVWISELGCREPSKTEPSGAPPDPDHSKADWLTKLFALTRFPRLDTVVFFNAERAFDWRLDSTPEALAVCRKAFAG